MSWFTGNLVRIWRTDSTQGSLKEIKSALSDYQEASSQAVKANSEVLEQIAVAIQNAQQPAVSPELAEAARRSVAANISLANATTAAISVISSSLDQSPSSLAYYFYGRPAAKPWGADTDPRDNGGRPRTPVIPLDTDVEQTARKSE